MCRFSSDGRSNFLPHTSHGNHVRSRLRRGRGGPSLVGGVSAWSVRVTEEELRGDVRSSAAGERPKEYDVGGDARDDARGDIMDDVGDVRDVLGDDRSRALSGEVAGDDPEENGSGEGVWRRLLRVGIGLGSGEISGSEYLSVELVCGLLSWKKEITVSKYEY